MTPFSFTILTIAVIALYGIALAMTVRVGKEQKSKRDEGVPAAVKENPRILNPVLLSYAATVVFIFLIVWIFRMVYKYPF